MGNNDFIITHYASPQLGDDPDNDGMVAVERIADAGSRGPPQFQPLV